MRPYDEVITPRANAAIPASDQAVSFVAEYCFAQRAFDILATASEA